MKTFESQLLELLREYEEAYELDNGSPSVLRTFRRWLSKRVEKEEVTNQDNCNTRVLEGEQSQTFRLFIDECVMNDTITFCKPCKLTLLERELVFDRNGKEGLVLVYDVKPL